MMQDLFDFFKTLWQDLIDWLKELQADTIVEIKDLSLDLFELMISGGVTAISAIVPPDVLASSLDTISSGLHPSVHYFLQMSGLAQGLHFIGTAVMFRISRKIYSFGII